MLKKIGMLVVISTLLVGCGSAMPNFYNGYYYMAGGSDCVDWRDIGNTRMMCMDSDGNETGYILPMTNQEMQVYKNTIRRDLSHQKQQEFSQALKQFSEGLAQRRKTTNAYRYKPPTLSYDSNTSSGYRSSTGRTYQYDLSDARQRALYRADPRARLRDRIEPDVLRKNDQNMGQYGGGILKNKKGAQW